MRINLKVPFKEKDKAKKKGAKWDGIEKTWYIVDQENLRPFMEWLPRHLRFPHGKAKRLTVKLVQGKMST